jgi:predicted nucleic acid-binding protein
MNNILHVILDSFALMVWLQEEPGETQVQNYLENAENGGSQILMPLINLGEVLYITERRYGLARAQDIQGVITELPIEILPATRTHVFAAAHIKANYPISYGDAFIVAAAQEFSATVLTGDPEFHSVENLISIEWLPQK